MVAINQLISENETLKAENDRLRRRLNEGPTEAESVLAEALALIGDVRDMLESE